MLVEVKCKKCKKVFIPAPQHVYRDQRGSYCSWHCFNHRKDKKKKGEKDESRTVS